MMYRNASIRHPGQPGVPQVMASQVVVPEFRHHFVPGRRISKRRRSDSYIELREPRLSRPGVNGPFAQIVINAMLYPTPKDHNHRILPTIAFANHAGDKHL
jgi:hypothetical protein